MEDRSIPQADAHDELWTLVAPLLPTPVCSPKGGHPLIGNHEALTGTPFMRETTMCLGAACHLLLAKLSDGPRALIDWATVKASLGGENEARTRRTATSAGSKYRDALESPRWRPKQFVADEAYNCQAPRDLLP